MLDLLDRFWIAFPLSYALTIGGLVSGYRRGSVPVEGRLVRALLAGVPVLFALLIAWAVIVWITEGAVKSKVLPGLQALLFFLFILSASALTGLVLARRGPAKEEVVRGTVILDEAPPDPAEIPPDTITLAGYPIAPLEETKHIKIVGTTGTGKSTMIRELLTGALGRGDRAVIADPDAGYLQRYYNPERGDVILNPFDSRASRWDLFAEITQLQDADHLALSFFPDNDGHDQNWRNYATLYVASILRQLNRLEDQRSLTEFYRLLALAGEEELRALLQGTPAARFHAEEGGKFLHSVQSVAVQHLSAIEHLGRQTEGNLISVRRWIREGTGVLFLPYRPTEIASLGRLISAWMRLAIFETLDMPEDSQRLWFIIDELAALGMIDGLADALTRVRKPGGRVVLGLQAIAQVRHAYGEAQSNSIVENCGTTVVLRCSASEKGGTAEFASRLIGERQILRKQHSVSRSSELFPKSKTRTESNQLETEPAVMPSEIEQLPDLEGFLKIAAQKEWRRVSLKTPPSHSRRGALNKYSWEATHATVIAGVIATLGIAVHIPGVQRAQPNAAATAASITPVPTGVPFAATQEIVHPRPASQRASDVDHQQTDPREITVGAREISNRYTLLSIDRKRVSSKLDELTVKLNVKSLAQESLSSPFESDMVELKSEGMEPIKPLKPFRNPLPSGTSRKQEVVFNIPSDLNLDHTSLQIHYYFFQSEIPLNLPGTLAHTP